MRTPPRVPDRARPRRHRVRRRGIRNLNGTLQTVALDARAQVEFDRDVVAPYRLVGYENRDIDDDDFTDEEVEAGAIGAGHAVTVLYALRLREDVGRQDLLDRTPGPRHGRRCGRPRGRALPETDEVHEFLDLLDRSASMDG